MVKIYSPEPKTIFFFLGNSSVGNLVVFTSYKIFKKNFW